MSQHRSRPASPGALTSIGGAALEIVGAQSTRHVISPLSDVDITIAMREATTSAGNIVLPLTSVCRAIGPSLGASPSPHIVLPLASVDSTAFELVGRVRCH